MAKKKTKAVVVGGAGFIGSHLTDELVRRGYEVWVIDNLSGGTRKQVNPQAKLRVVDIRNLAKIKPVIAGARFVFHLAALPRVQYSIDRPIETSEVNILGTVNVLTAAQAGGVERVVYSASSSAYGEQSKMPLVESMSANPLSPYGLQKYVGELLCRVWHKVYGLETVSLRYFNVYGSRQNPDGAYALVIGKFLKQRQAGQPLSITGDGRQTRDFTHVRDVVWANLLAALGRQVGRGEVINVGAGRNRSINEIAKLIGGPVEYLPPRLEPKDTKADNRLARKLLGWRPEVKIEQGLAELKKEWGLV